MSELKNKELGDFLKRKRERISPLQLGLPKGQRRRTPGLKREEVAILSGIGLSWYTWLEQGRNINVSTEVLDSIARTLMLTKDEIIYMYSLVNKIPVEKKQRSINAEVNASLQRILDSLKFSPAFIIDERWNVLACNKAAKVAFIDFMRIDEKQRNLVWLMFNHNEYKDLFCDWEITARGMLSRFRSMSDKYIEDPWMNDFIKDMKCSSKQFEEWWSKHEIQIESNIYKKINNSIVGELVFEMNCLNIQGNNKLNLIINIPFDEYSTEEKMKRLLKVQ